MDLTYRAEKIMQIILNKGMRENTAVKQEINRLYNGVYYSRNFLDFELAITSDCELGELNDHEKTLFTMLKLFLRLLQDHIASLPICMKMEDREKRFFEECNYVIRANMMSIWASFLGRFQKDIYDIKTPSIFYLVVLGNHRVSVFPSGKIMEFLKMHTCYIRMAKA